MSVRILLLVSVKPAFHQCPLEVQRVQQEPWYPSVMLSECAFKLLNILTGMSFGTAILVANEMEAKDAIACPVTSVLGSGTDLWTNLSYF